MLIPTSFNIIYSPGPTLKNARLAYAQNLSKQNVPLTWLKGKKSKAFIWWRELWLFSFLNEAERKVFECETSTKRKSCSRKTACAAKYALWWVGKLSDSTVFLTLERVYRIHNHKFSQNHASETHGSTGSIVAAGYPSIFKRSTWETLKLTTVIFEWGIWLRQTWWIVTITPAEWWILHIPKHVTSWLTKLQAHQYFSDRRLRANQFTCNPFLKVACEKWDRPSVLRKLWKSALRGGFKMVKKQRGGSRKASVKQSLTPGNFDLL